MGVQQKLGVFFDKAVDKAITLVLGPPIEKAYIVSAMLEDEWREAVSKKYEILMLTPENIKMPTERETREILAEGVSQGELVRRCAGMQVNRAMEAEAIALTEGGMRPVDAQRQVIEAVLRPAAATAARPVTGGLTPVLVHA